MSSLKANSKDNLIYLTVLLLWFSVIYLISYLGLSNNLMVISLGLVASAASVLLLRSTAKFKSFFEKFLSIRSEATKISWAGLSDTRKTVFFVAMLIGLFSIFMWLVDTLFTLIIKSML
jgi:preprotein translocase subunit SecE